MHFRKASVDAPPAVRSRGITKYFGDVVALDGVDLDVAAGQIHGLVGPNGAGKTTLLGLLLGLAVADGGSLEILGRPVGRALPAPDGVAGFVDGPGLYPSLTARQNLAALAALRGRGRDRVDEVLEQVGLTDVADDRVRGFSLGMRQRLGLAAALLTRPRLLVLDEPANGLDPAGKTHVHRVLTGLAADGHRRGALQPPDGRSGGAVLRGHHPRAPGGWSSPARWTSWPPRAANSTTGCAPPTRHGRPPSWRRHAGLRLVDDRRWRGDRRARGARAGAGPRRTGGAARAAPGVAVRELAPVVSPLEAAFLALTDAGRPTDDR